LELWSPQKILLFNTPIEWVHAFSFLYAKDLPLPFTVQVWWRKVWRAEIAQQDYHVILHRVSCLGRWNLTYFEWCLFFPFLISSDNPWTGQGRTKLPSSSCISSINIMQLVVGLYSEPFSTRRAAEGLFMSRPYCIPHISKHQLSLLWSGSTVDPPISNLKQIKKKRQNGFPPLLSFLSVIFPFM